jgi:uncharacterized protein YbbC (DUF1343 family)
VHSLFGKTRRPTAEMLSNVDVLLVDLVDVGTRFYTYASTVEQVMLAAAEHGVAVVILDRPNPLGGLAVEGPLPDEGVRTFVHYHRLPVRHGMTLGELAALVASDKRIGVSLGVIDAQGWRRGMLQRDTGLPFVAPSPNLPGEQAVLLYPALGLLESTNLSVGRGTDAPFQLLGAPWLEADGLAAALSNEDLPGLKVSTTRFTPSARPYRGQACAGLRLEVTDAGAFRPIDSALALGRALARLHPTEWEVEKLERMLRHRKAYLAVKRGAGVGRVKALYAEELQAFIERRARFLRYPACEARP